MTPPSDTLKIELWPNDPGRLKAASSQDASTLFRRLKKAFLPVPTAMTETGTPTTAVRRNVVLSVPLAVVVLWIVGGLVALIVSSLVAVFFKSAQGTTYTSGKMISTLGQLGGPELPLMVGMVVGGGVGGWAAFRLIDAVARAGKNPSSKLVLRAMLAVLGMFAVMAFVSGYFAFPRWDMRIGLPFLMAVGAWAMGLIPLDCSPYLLCRSCGQYLSPDFHAGLPLEGVEQMQAALAEARPSKAVISALLWAPAHHKHGSLCSRTCPGCGSGIVEMHVTFSAAWSERLEDRRSESWITSSTWLRGNQMRPLVLELDHIRAKRIESIQQGKGLETSAPPTGPAPSFLEVPLPTSAPADAEEEKPADATSSVWAAILAVALIGGILAFFAWLIFTGPYNGGGRTNIALVPGGTQLFAAGPDGVGRLWDTGNGQMAREFRAHRQAVNCAAVSPDGGIALTGGGATGINHDTKIRKWSLQDGRETAVLNSEDFVFALAIAPGGLLAASGHGNGKIILWNLAGNTQAAELTDHKGTIRAVAFSPDGRFLISGDAAARFSEADRTIRLWDVATRRQLRRYAGHTGDVTSLCFSPDGRTFYSASEDKTIRQWDAAEEKELRSLTGHTGAVHDISLSQDGTLLLSASEDATVRTWNTSTGREARQFPGNEEPFFRVLLNKDGTRLFATHEKSVQVWDYAAGALLHTLVPPGR
ncbi:MAG: WD40 repeat domain-containing protein [Prosthecobacter sp.]